MAEIFEDSMIENDDQEIKITDIIESKPKIAKNESNSKNAFKAAAERRQEVARNIPRLNNFNRADLDDIEIFLMVDNREKRNNNDVNYFYDRFCTSGLKTELRTLPLGDFIWTIRIRNDEFEDEIVGESALGDEVEEVNNPNPDEQD